MDLAPGRKIIVIHFDRDRDVLTVHPDFFPFPEQLRSWDTDPITLMRHADEIRDVLSTADVIVAFRARDTLDALRLRFFAVNEPFLTRCPEVCDPLQLWRKSDGRCLALTPKKSLPKITLPNLTRKFARRELPADYSGVDAARAVADVTRAIISHYKHKPLCWIGKATVYWRHHSDPTRPHVIRSSRIDTSKPPILPKCPPPR